MDIDEAWKSTCKILLKDEIGGLEKYEKWIGQFREPFGHAKSPTSGQDVFLTIQDYGPGSRAIGFDEINHSKNPERISINDAKDLDSLLEAVAEVAQYSGNIVLGNSKIVERSSGVIDSFYVLDSNMVSESKYIAYSSIIKNSEYIFGANLEDYSKFLIRAYDTYNNTRGFEIWSTYLCSDVYYVLRCEDCHDCMFSFNLRAKRHAIGNLELPKDKYAQLKEKLLGEMRDMLKKDKKLPSLLEIIAKSRETCTDASLRAAIAGARETPEALNQQPVEDAFEKTTDIVFGKKLDRMDDYREWLVQHVKTSTEEKSAMSGKDTILGEFFPFPLFPKDRLLTMEEGLEAGQVLKMDVKEVEGLTMSNAHKPIGKIAYFATKIRLGETSNLIHTFLGYKAQNCYWGGIFSNTKYSAFSHFARNSEYMFGSTMSYACAFCVNCYNSNYIARSFEIDCSFSCSDCLFCHNAENCTECMFCFNVKSKRYAIGNVEYPKEEYLKIKKMMLAEISQKLEKDKKLDYSIYNIGSKK